MKKILLGFLVLGAVGFAQIKSNTNALSQAQTTLSSTQENRGQTNSDPQPEMVHQSPFDAVKGKKEDQSKRDAFSKHYINEDGSFTALIGAGPIHYERNGQFLDIDHTITQSSTMNFPFANTTNLMESYFGATVEYGVKSKTMEGEVVEFMNPTMYWEVNGQAMGTQQAANTQAQIQADKATYPNIYGDISAEYKVLTGKREMNYIIPNPQALGAVPAGADYLVFTEDVVLPFGWTSSLTETGIMIKDAMGQEIYLYENPHSTDAESHALREENTIFETLQIGNTLTIKTKVKTEWLLSNERVFPVMVDPTVNAWPTGTDDYNTGSIDNFGTGNKTANADIYVGMRHAYGASTGTRRFFRGWASFNLTNIPNNAEISNVTLGLYLGINTMNSTYGEYVRIGPIDSAIPNQVNGATLYNLCGEFGTGANHWLSISAGVPPGDVSVDFLQNQIDYVESRLPTNIFSLGFAPEGDYDYNYTEQVGIYGSNRPQTTSNGRPYLIITYTEPITDRTLEVVGAGDGASHADGSYTYDNDTPLVLTSGTRAGYEFMGWTGTGNIPPTGTLGALTFNIIENSSIEWLWEAIQPEFHNYGGSEQLAFNNSRIDTENPVFRLSHKGGTANGYQIQISNSADFTSGTVSQTFTGTYAAEEENNFTFTDGSFTSGTTYYVRAAVDMGGGYLTDGWTTETYSFTYQSEQEIPSWFQTTQAQFQNDALSGVVANASHDVVTGAGGNKVVNGDFTSALTTGWTITGTSGTGRVVDKVNNPNNWEGGDWLRIGSPNFSSGSGGTGSIIVAQEIDLTNVSQLTFKTGYYYSVGGPFDPTPNTKIEFMIGGALNNTTGTTAYTNQPNYSGQGYSYYNFGIQTIDVSNYSGVQVIKFVMTYNASWNGNGSVYYLIDDVIAEAPPAGTITSTPIHLASVQDATAYQGITWNQTLGGGELTLKVQHSADGLSGWTDVVGYTNISQTGDGEKTHDLSDMTPYPHIRLVGTLNGQNVALQDWAVNFKEEECTESTTWNGSDWSNGAPTESPLKKVIFTGNYNPLASPLIDLYACSIEVVGAAQVTLRSGFNFIVENEVKVASGAKLTIQNGANLVQINDDAVNVGEITVEKLFTFSTDREQYNLIGSPVIDQNLKNIYGGDPITQTYVEATNKFVNSDGAYSIGIGQSINEAKVTEEPNSLTTAIFEGVPFNGKHTLSGLTAQKTGFHLIANPYPSQLDLDQLYTDNLDLEPRFLFWDNRGNEQLTQYGDGYQGDHYAQYNAFSGGIAAEGETVVDQTKVPNGLAAVGSAFMVRLTTPGMIGNINFNNAQRAVGKGVDFLGKTNDASEKDRYWLTLTTPTNWQVMQLVAYFEGGNDDYGLDDNKAPNSSTDFYSKVSQHQLAIQGKSSFVVNDTIALGYRAFETGEHRIDIFDQEGVFANGQNIYLIDQDLDIIHNLSEGTYHFRTEAGEFNDRFTIVYEEDEVLSTIDFANGDIQVYRQDKNTVIRSLRQDLRELKIFNLNGQLLLHEDRLSGKYYHLPEGRLGKQVLLLNAKTADGKLHSFKILTH